MGGLINQPGLIFFDFKKPPVSPGRERELDWTKLVEESSKFMRHNKPGGFCVYKTALSFSTGAGLAHPAAMRAPLFYLPRASGAQNLVCLTAHKIFTVVGPAARVSSSTSLDFVIFGGPTFLTPIGFLLPSSFLFLSALPDIFIV